MDSCGAKAVPNREENSREARKGHILLPTTSKSIFLQFLSGEEFEMYKPLLYDLFSVVYNYA